MKTEDELIARFMGYTYYPTPSDFFPNGRWYHPQLKTYDGNGLKYNTSWDWLMPVVEKIEGLRVEAESGLGYEFAVIIQENECIIESHTRPTGHDFKSFRSNGSTKIRSCYNSIVQFIKWYSTQQH